MANTNQKSLTTPFQTFLFLVFLSHGVLSQSLQDQEQTVLLKLKQHWGNLPVLGEWTPSNNSHCSWPGITCTSNSVTELSLNNVDIQTTVPPFICDLKNLTVIDLGNNFIPGEFPRAVFNCSKLQLLNLSQNYFVGRLPDDIDKLVQLQSFYLGGNNFTGDIPPAIGKLQELRVLSMGGNLFNGSLPPEIGDLSNLEYLRLSSNYQLMPSRLPSAYTKLRKLKLLWVFNSNLIGEIPESIGDLEALEWLDLSQNDLHGKIPDGLFTLKNLSIVYLFENKLSGQIPQMVEALNLTQIDLSENNLTGIIREDFAKLTNLTHLSLFSNQLSGSIPEGIGRLPALENCNLFGNNLHGTIPRSIFQRTKLRNLDLSSNNLAGTVEFEKLSKLESLDLSSNNLSFSFNNSINYTFDSLSYLRLSSCNIGEFPHFLRYLKGLKSLDLSSNQIQGSVPKWLWEVSKESMINLNLSHNFLSHLEPLPWDNLEILDLSSNLFSGSLAISSSSLLKYFKASKNQFSGDIPTSICSITYLEIVDLSHNFSGNIPQCMGNFTERLRVVDLRMNKLHGPIPVAFTEGNSLTNINLNGNRLEGTLPRSLVNCSSLEVLDFGNNQLKDTFPDWLESLPNLQVLVLRANKFYGSIGNPKTRSPFYELRILDISYNEFSGALPLRYIENFNAMIGADRVKMEYMSNHDYFSSVAVSMKGLYVELEKILTSLTTIDLSSNNFTYEIPTSIGRLVSLKGLNLSHNKLGGIIPSSLGDLINLEWLDLSSNELVGRIPDQLAGLPWITFLNLSQNKLVGPIPIGRQFNTFNNDSYSENPGLCGFPLSKICGNEELQHDRGDDGEHNDDMFYWKVVMMGYASGMVIGMSLGYMALFSRSCDYWFQKRFGREHRHISIAPLRGKRKEGA